MKAVEFVFWLQGYFEIAEKGTEPAGLTYKQIDCIKKHLALVFKHEIDPSAGPPAHQQELNDIHNPPPAAPTKVRPQPPDPVYRC